MKGLLVLSLFVLTAQAQSVDPDITQSNIHNTICIPGYTAKVRPPTSYTSKLKARQMAERALKGKPADYEEDHIIPLALGGCPDCETNLEPQIWPEAKKKDRVEVRLHTLVCSGVLSLSKAQKAMSDWKSSYRRYVK